MKLVPKNDQISSEFGLIDRIKREIAQKSDPSNTLLSNEIENLDENNDDSNY